MQKNVAMPQVYTLAQIEHHIFSLALQSVICFRFQPLCRWFHYNLQDVPDHHRMPVFLSTDHKDDQDDRQKQLLETITRVE